MPPMPDESRAEAPRFTVPEFTRALRGLASPRGLGRPEHMGVFGPLIAARKLAEQAGSVRARVAAFDAARLERALAESIAAIGAARVPKEGADRRALTARLTDLAGPVYSALRAIESAAGRVRADGDPPRDESWSGWVAAVQELFNATDKLWFEIEPELGPRRRVKNTSGAKIVRVLIGALVGLGAAAGAAHAQHVTVRVPGVAPESLRARGFDVVGMEKGTPLVVADPAQLAKMEARGWHATPMPVIPAIAPRVANRSNALAIAPTVVYRDYDDPARGIRFFIDSMVKNNPLVSAETLGVSYQGRPMIAVKIGPKGDSPQRPNVLFMATYHAREWAATEMALRLIKYLAAAPGSNARVDSLVQARDIWILPVANPDGFEYTFTGDRLWRKTRSPQAGGAVGVDMNRNHRQNWGLDEVGSSSDPTSDIYRGTSPASEIETRNVEAFHAKHPPVVSVSYHTYAGLLLFSPSAVYGQLSADLPVYRTLAGTNQRPAVRDNLPGSQRTYESPNTSWTLYTTNGEYNDWASAKFGTLSFTPEISSGYNSSINYYGFQFPDDESQLQQLFLDNLPFALDAIESARDPFAYVSPTTFFHSDRVVLESVSPTIQATVPAAAASGAKVSAPGSLTFRIDTLNSGKYTRRLVATPAARPTSLTIAAGGLSAAFNVLAINGAELNETGWSGAQFTRDSTFAMAGKYSWFTQSGGDLKSPVIDVPADADTVSLTFWTRYAGSGFTEFPFADVNLSVDGGASFQRVMRLEGFAPLFYPEQVVIGGVKGKHIVFDFVATGLPWNLDEIAVVAHGAVTSVPATTGVALRPSENPVRHSVVYFAWPYGNAVGDILAYDFSGRLVWKANVTTGGNIAWDLNSARVANGVYVVIARTGTQTTRLKLFVTR